MSESVNSTKPTSAFGFNLQVPNFGNGFVELAMLTILMGPASAATLVLGNHGAAGLAWATMSAFGTGRVIGACLSGACAPWLREIMGLRSKLIDSCLGMELSSKANGNITNIIRSRYAAEGPLALSMDSREISKEQAGGKLVWKEIYAFDDSTSKLIKSIPEAVSNSPSVQAYKDLSVDTKSPLSSSSSIQNNKSFSSPTGTISGEDINISVYTYPPFQYYRQHHVKFQLLMLGLSLIKVGECFALWWLSGSPLLSLATSLPWMYFFIVAVIVGVDNFNKTRIPPDGYVDMLSGQLPKMTHSGAGGARKIILGVSQNTKNTARWKMMWGMGALVCLATIIFTYIVLSHESTKILSIWVFFQVLWTFIRIIVYHFAEPMDNSVDRVVAERVWSTLPSPLKYRVVKLMSALASYLTSVHPRGEIAYRTTAVSPEDLRIIIFDSSPNLYFPLPQVKDSFADPKKKLIEIDINAVIGDPTLSSAAWVAGARHLTPTDLYDCCIISFRICTLKIDAQPQIITIPCARVLSGFPMFSKNWPQIDDEVTRLPGSPQFIPKHTANTGGNWCYFIPCEPGLWLYLKRNITEDVAGKYTAEALTDVQVTEMLAEGDMNISLSHVDDIKRTVGLSEQARQILLQILVP